jgi:arginine-tRNA-protein transferase
VTSSLRDLKVYTTYPHSCSYLRDKEATTLFVDPRTTIDAKLYSELSVLGFRRSGAHLYRPHCNGCTACVPARVPVKRFKPSRSQKRAWNRNRDLTVREVGDIRHDEYYLLYERYIQTRHQDGDMYPPNREQYESFLSGEWGVTRFYRIALEGCLVGVAVVDELTDGLSAIYTFFDGLPVPGLLDPRLRQDGLQGAVPAAGIVSQRALGGIAVALSTCKITNLV